MLGGAIMGPFERVETGWGRAMAGGARLRPEDGGKFAAGGRIFGGRRLVVGGGG